MTTRQGAALHSKPSPIRKVPETAINLVRRRNQMFPIGIYSSPESPRLARKSRRNCSMSKLVTLTGLAFVLAVSYAAAQQNTMSAGRPSAVLTPEQCDTIWKKAVPSGDTLAQANAAPYIVNFSQVD